MVVVAGSRYYLLVNACRTVCTFVRTVEDVEGQKFLIAVPAANFTFDPKTDRAVATTTENTTELVRFLFIRSLSGCRLAPNPSFPYREWAHKPRLDALESVITAEPEILPLTGGMEPTPIVSDVADAQSQEESDVEDAPATRRTAAAKLLTRRSGAEQGRTGGGQSGESADFQAAILEKLSALEVAHRGSAATGAAQFRQMSKRLDALEETRRAGPARDETGAFDFHTYPLRGEATGEDQDRLIQELRSMRPPNVSFSQQEPPRLGAQGRDASPEAPSLPVPDALSERDLAMIAALTGRPARPQPVSFGFDAIPSEKLYKLEGVRARIMQDRLEDQIATDPSAIIEEFETAVRREAPPDDPQEKDIALGQMLRAFRSATPAKEHPIYVRMIETLLVVYHHQRNGRGKIAQARVALLLASLDQALKDNGRCEKRGDYINCMPPPPCGQYRVHTQEERAAFKDKPYLGAITRFAGPTRGSTARALHLENAGAQ